jgi:maltose alpha-D-glucosyltransferase / alpha-amylase
VLFRSDRNAGFSQAHPHRLFLPLINDPEYHYETVNVETQQNNSSSLLWWMKRIIGIRKRYQAFGRGDIQFLSPENAKVLAFTRSFEDEHLLVLANLSRHPQVVELELPDFEGYRPVEVFGQTPFPTIEGGTNRFTLGPYGYYWFVLEPEEVRDENEPKPLEVAWPPNKWTQLAKANGLTMLAEDILPNYLNRSDRFVPRSRTLDSTKIETAQLVSYEGGQALLLIVKGIFTEGFPEWYFVPLTMGEGDPDQLPEGPESHRVVALLTQKNQKGYLYEATEDSAFHQYLLRALLGQEGRSPQGFRFVRRPKLNGHGKLEDVLHSRVVKTSGENLPLAFGDRFFLKVFRRLEKATNPDLEVNQRNESHQELPVPGYLAHLQVGENGKSPFTLAMLQPYVSNQGTAWTYFFDAARRYLERVQTSYDRPPMLKQRPQPEQPMDPDWRELVGNMPLERAELLGQTLANLHLGMMSRDERDFKPEEFSLHYQRSLYSSFQSLVRSTFQPLRKQKDLPGASTLLELRKPLLDRLKRIYAHKIEARKVRIHGDLHLEKVLFTGRDFCVFDFEGERIRSYSELRLKKSPVRDLASLLCSVYYVTLAALRTQVEPDQMQESELLAWAEVWYDSMVAAFLTGYLPKAREAELVPPEQADWEILMEIFLAERHLYELGFELQKDRDMAQIPLRGLLRLLEDSKELA